MSSSTQAMQANTKAQATNQLSGKSKATGTDSQGIAFEALFSSALNQGKPTAQLNAIEAQLRDSLFKDEKKPAKYDSEPALNTEAAQSALWAQRNWMQQSGVNMASNSSSAMGSLNAAKPTAVQLAQSQSVQAQPKQAAPQSNTPDKSEVASSEGSAGEAAKPAQTSSTEAKSPQSASNVPAQQGQPNQALTGADHIASGDLTAPNLVKPGLAAQSTQALPTTTATQTAPIEQATQVAAGHDTKAKPELVSTTQSPETVQVDEPAADKKPTMAGLQVKSDANATNSATRTEIANTSNNAPTSNNNIAAQVAPQIATQVAKQQFSLKGEEFTGLKTGDKIMASGTAATGQTNAAALPTTLNGLGSSSGTNPQALIKTPVNQPGFAKEVGQTVQWALGKNMSTVDIRVNPETFGPMNMRLIQKGQQVQLIIRTQDEGSANLLAQALGGLKEVLGQNGLQLNQVQIQHGQPQPHTNQQAGDTAQQQFAQQQQGGQRGGSGSGKQSEEPDSITNTVQPNKRPDGKLDLFA